MSEYPAGRGHHSADLQPRLRLAALTAVIIGVLLLAAAAFLLSYAGIHRIALSAGVSPALARLYPVIFDAMLVIASAGVLALRGAGWLTRVYVWLCLLLLLGAVAAGDAVHAMSVALPRQPTRAVVAVTPWALLLLAFGLLLGMLRHLRKIRLANPQPPRAARRGRAVSGSAAVSEPVEGTAVARAPVSWMGAGGTETARALPAAAP